MKNYGNSPTYSPNNSNDSHNDLTDFWDKYWKEQKEQREQELKELKTKKINKLKKKISEKKVSDSELNEQLGVNDWQEEINNCDEVSIIMTEYNMRKEIDNIAWKKEDKNRENSANSNEPYFKSKPLSLKGRILEKWPIILGVFVILLIAIIAYRKNKRKKK
jgi:hypothetical protein